MNSHVDTGYWMDIVEKIAMASTCRVKIGTLIVKDGIIVAHGFLGSIPSDYHCEDSCGCLMVKNNGMFGSGDKESCIRTIHSEMNAVLKCTVRGTEKNGWMECYTTYKPCLNCFKALLAIGVRWIIYGKPYTDEWRDTYIKNLSPSITDQLTMFMCSGDSSC